MNILIVEDEIALAQALEQILKNNGHHADVVCDGVSALEYAGGFPYDLVILDVMLPRLDGFDVVKAMRELGNGTPVLMLTARATVPDKVTGLNAGADDYMTKPFDTSELLARINALTRRTGEVVLNRLTYADLTLDLDNALLCSKQDSVHLSYKELGVARMFLSTPTKTITKDELIVSVWGSDADITDNNVESYISFLRKKLKYLHSAVSIKTIQKIGYRLEVSEC